MHTQKFSVRLAGFPYILQSTGSEQTRRKILGESFRTGEGIIGPHDAALAHKSDWHAPETGRPNVHAPIQKDAVTQAGAGIDLGYTHTAGRAVIGAVTVNPGQCLHPADSPPEIRITL
jgi:hypothetical protein